MPHPLVELTRTRRATATRVVVKNYNILPALCRRGVWVGLETLVEEHVVLSFEHDPEELYVGWMINGTTVSDPGFGGGTPPSGLPAPGAPSIRYATPFEFLSHKLSLTSTPGLDLHKCLSVQVLYRRPSDGAAPARFGPAATVCLHGLEVVWPALKAAEEARCRSALLKLLRTVLPRGLPRPPGPVENWLSTLDDEEVMRVAAQAEALETLDAKADRQLIQAVRADLVATLRAHIPQTPLPAPPAASARSKN